MYMIYFVYKKRMNAGKLLKKYLAGEKMTKKEIDYLWKKCRDKADQIFSQWIRNRDKHNGCITKEVSACQNSVDHNCHWIERWRYSHRRDEENCFWWCVSCNTYHEAEHKIFFTMYQIKKHWQEWVDEQLFKRNKKKPTIDELLEIIKKYRD